MEVGNIICGNVISSFANALNKKFYFSLPVIEKISYNNDLILKGVRVKFEIKEFDIQGNLMFAMSPESFDLFNNSLSR
nr:chemotaxis protein CheC [Marinitoga sp. 1138]